jgi:hypothetical protein
MKKQNYTAILEFEVIEPTNEIEYIGEKITLSAFGEYCPKKSMRGYSLLYLLDNPKYYRVSRIIERGDSITLDYSNNRMNYAKKKNK